MSYSTLTEEQIQKCKDIFDRILDDAELEVDREYLTYDELERALVMLTNKKFEHRNIFYKLISEIETTTAPNRISFVDLLDIYKK